MKTLHKLSALALVAIGQHLYDKIVQAMTGPHMGYQPYGWDWDTAWMLHERLVRAYTRVRNEFVRRAKAAGMSLQQFHEHIVWQQMVK